MFKNDKEKRVALAELTALWQTIRGHDIAWFYEYAKGIAEDSKLSISFDQTRKASAHNQSLRLFELQSLVADKYRSQLDSGKCGDLTWEKIGTLDRIQCLCLLDSLPYEEGETDVAEAATMLTRLLPLGLWVITT